MGKEKISLRVCERGAEGREGMRTSMDIVNVKEGNAKEGDGWLEYQLSKSSSAESLERTKGSLVGRVLLPSIAMSSLKLMAREILRNEMDWFWKSDDGRSQRRKSEEDESWRSHPVLEGGRGRKTRGSWLAGRFQPEERLVANNVKESHDGSFPCQALRDSSFPLIEPEQTAKAADERSSSPAWRQLREQEEAGLNERARLSVETLWGEGAQFFEDDLREKP